MKNYLEYQGVEGTVRYSADDDILYGELIGIPDIISYQGKTIQELKEDFQNAVNDYFDICKEQHREPFKVFKGNFNIRISPELHRKAYFYAQENNESLNAVVGESLAYYLDAQEKKNA